MHHLHMGYEIPFFLCRVFDCFLINCKLLDLSNSFSTSMFLEPPRTDMETFSIKSQIIHILVIPMALELHCWNIEAARDHGRHVNEQT